MPGRRKFPRAMQTRRRTYRRRVEDLGAPNQPSTTTHAATAPSSSVVATSTTTTTTATIFSNPSAASSSTVCTECLDKWLNQRRVTCPHCRERLPNELVIRNMEASDALLSDPDFERRIRAVSLRFRCLCLKILRDKKFFFDKCRISVYITTTEPFRHNVLRAMS